MSRRPGSLRVRLAILGLALVAVPVLVLLGVIFSTEQEADRIGTDPGDATAATTVERTETTGVSPLVTLTALAMTVPMGLVVWWWAGRAVRPIARITAVADDIQYGSLDRRIALAGAPTEVQALADSFDRMLDRLATASTVQQRLVEDTSHQLRTPLTVLRTNVDLLLSDVEPVTEEHRAGLERTRRAVDRLQATVDELLATARTESLRSLQTGNDLAEIARRSADEINDQAELRDVTVTVVAPPSLPADLDPAGVGRALTCLLDNAVRHSPAGGTVVIEAGVHDHRAFLAVTDQGPGIDPAKLDRVFDRYWRGDQDDAGRGIGLSIVQQVADTHDGVELTLPHGGGTRFTLWFQRPPGRS